RGASGGARDRQRRPEGPAMTLYLPRTDTAQVAEALSAERLSIGGGAMNMVLTLVVVTDEADHYDAVRAATEAGREHPSRIIALIRRDPEAEPAIDAEIRRPGTSGPGEALLLRLYGPLGEHADSVITPLLVPDAPVVAWARPARPVGRPDRPAGAPADHRRAARRRAAGGPARPGPRLPARRHRPDLDPAHPVAVDAGQHHGPPARLGHRRRGDRGGPLPQRRPARRLALPAAGGPGAAHPVQRPRHHRGPARYRRRGHRAAPAGRPGGDAVPPGPAGPDGGAGPAPRRRGARRGAAPAGPRRDVREDRRPPGRTGRGRHPGSRGGA